MDGGRCVALQMPGVSSCMGQPDTVPELRSLQMRTPNSQADGQRIEAPPLPPCILQRQAGAGGWPGCNLGQQT